MVVQIALAAVALLFVAQTVPLFIRPEILSGVVDWARPLPVAIGVVITIGVGVYLLSGVD